MEVLEGEPPEDDPVDLPGAGQGQLRHEDDVARVLKRGGVGQRHTASPASSVSRRPSRVTTNANGFSYLISSGMGTTQACMMSGCRSSIASTSPG